MRKRNHYLYIAIVLVVIGGLLLFRITIHTENYLSRNGTVHLQKTTDGFELFRNGKPFNIRGASGNSHLKELSNIGGNTIRVYDTINLLAILNEAKMNGLAVIVDIPIPRYHKTYNVYLSNADNDQLKKNVKQLVRKYRSHPSLLMWNLGNEVEYPLVLFKNSFITTFNDLIDIIHKEDPNHPVSTSIPSVSKKQIISLYLHSPDIDLLSYNIFGNLKNLKSDLTKISYFFGKRPYYISEWGHDGPWEHSFTSWGTPIEPSSSKKAEQLKTRHKTLIQKMDPTCLGSLVFYWGEKHERTHTWFSLFLENHGRSEIVEQIKHLWQNSYSYTPSIGLDYMLVDEKGAHSNLVFAPDQIIKAMLKFNHAQYNDLQISWEIYPEVWQYQLNDKEKKPRSITGSILNTNIEQATFITPKDEGPYRIFAYIHDKKGNFATTNTPFYVLNPNIKND